MIHENVTATQTLSTRRKQRRQQRRQFKNILIKEAQQDIDTVEAKISCGVDKKTEDGLKILLDILYMHSRELINSEV